MAESLPKITAQHKDCNTAIIAAYKTGTYKLMRNQRVLSIVPIVDLGHYSKEREFLIMDLSPSVPWIQLKGHWLQQAGFEIDTPVKVSVMNGCLVLTTE